MKIMMLTIDIPQTAKLYLYVFKRNVMHYITRVITWTTGQTIDRTPRTQSSRVCAGSFATTPDSADEGRTLTSPQRWCSLPRLRSA